MADYYRILGGAYTPDVSGLYFRDSANTWFSGIYTLKIDGLGLAQILGTYGMVAGVMPYTGVLFYRFNGSDTTTPLGTYTPYNTGATPPPTGSPVVDGPFFTTRAVPHPLPIPVTPTLGSALAAHPMTDPMEGVF